MPPNISGLKRWPKGQSGNPGGRPKGIGSLAREMTKEGKLPFDYLLSLIADERADHKDRIEGAKILLAYGYGKPTETVINVDVAGNAGVLPALSAEILTDLARSLRPSNAPTPLDAPDLIVEGELVPTDVPTLPALEPQTPDTTPETHPKASDAASVGHPAEPTKP